MGERIPVLLLVDDNPHEAALLREALAEIGFACELRAARGGHEALEGLALTDEGDLPHLLLLDLNMPTMDGHELLRELKRDGPVADIPVIVFSTSRRPADLLRAYAHGARGFIAKPATWDDYVEAAACMARHWRAVESGRVPTDREPAV